MTTTAQQASRLFHQLTLSAQPVLVAPQRNGSRRSCRFAGCLTPAASASAFNGAASRFDGCAQRAPFTH